MKHIKLKEEFFNSFKSPVGDKDKELTVIHIDIYPNDNAFISNLLSDRFQDNSKVVKILMKGLGDYISDDNIYKKSKVNRFNINDIDKIEEFFNHLGYKRSESNVLKGRRQITFKSKISEKELKEKLNKIKKS